MLRPQPGIGIQQLRFRFSVRKPFQYQFHGQAGPLLSPACRASRPVFCSIYCRQSIVFSLVFRLRKAYHNNRKNGAWIGECRDTAEWRLPKRRLDGFTLLPPKGGHSSSPGWSTVEPGVKAPPQNVPEGGERQCSRQHNLFAPFGDVLVIAPFSPGSAALHLGLLKCVPFGDGFRVKYWVASPRFPMDAALRHARPYCRS